MGEIQIGSKLLKWDKDIDYKVFTRGDDLYDTYDVSLNNFSLSLTQDMSEYKNWRNAKQVWVIKEVSFDVKVW